MTCTFFGHRYVQKEIEPMLRSTLIDLIDNHDCSLFFVGNQGEFDAMVTGILFELSDRYPHPGLYGSRLSSGRRKRCIQ